MCCALWRMISFAYFQVGAIECFGAFFTYFVAMSQAGFWPRRLVDLRREWDSRGIHDLEDSYGQEWVSPSLPHTSLFTFSPRVEKIEIFSSTLRHPTPTQWIIFLRIFIQPARTRPKGRAGQMYSGARWLEISSGGTIMKVKIQWKVSFLQQNFRNFLNKSF